MLKIKVHLTVLILVSYMIENVTIILSNSIRIIWNISDKLKVVISKVFISIDVVSNIQNIRITFFSMVATFSKSFQVHLEQF